MNEQTVQSSFADDHDRLDQLLVTFRQSKRVDFDRAKQAFQQFRVGLRQHILREEGILFPLFEEKTGMHDHGPTVVMRAEHREIARRLETVHDKVRARDLESDQEEDALVVSLSMHNHKEENILYPALDRLLSSEEKAAAFREMEALPAEASQACCGRGPSEHARADRYSPNAVVARL
jgi:iron-sulfur cluster repair protein YtfE (RIC family)